MYLSKPHSAWRLLWQIRGVVLSWQLGRSPRNCIHSWEMGWMVHIGAAGRMFLDHWSIRCCVCACSWQKPYRKHCWWIPLHPHDAQGGWEVPPKGVSTRQIVGQWKLLLALPCHGKRGTAHVHSLWKRCWASNYAHNDSRLHWEYCPVSINHLCSWLEHGYDCLWLDAHRRFVHYPRVCSFSFDLWLTSGFVFHYSLGSLIWTIWGSNWRQEVLRSLDMALSKKNFVQHMHSSAKLAAYGGSATWMHIVKLGMALRLGHAAHIWLLNSGLNVSYQFTAFILFFL